MYIFIREDLIPEQMIVQASHAAHMVGCAQKDKEIPHVVLIGAKDVNEIIDISGWLSRENIAHEMFYEPDIGEYTAIATHSLRGPERIPFVDFETLKIKKD
jgi:hypothetical protein